MIKKSDIEVQLSKSSWIESASIEPGRYLPSATRSGVEIIVRNKSPLVIRWCSVDIFYEHAKTYYWRSDSIWLEGKAGPELANTRITVRGAEHLAVNVGIIAVGHSQTRRVTFVSRYADRDKAGGLPKDCKLLRVYGEDVKGDKFVFDLHNRTVSPVVETDAWCFIANAAFEDEGHPTVNELRRVRDELLRPTRPGRAFIKFYYRHSPRVAAWMATRPRIKRATRAVLTPLARSTRAVSALRREGWRSLFQNNL